MKTKKILLTRTVFYKGRHYPPNSDHEWPADIVDELIEKDAGEPVFDVAGTKVRPKKGQKKESRNA